jgi:hypothetical protein
VLGGARIQCRAALEKALEKVEGGRVPVEGRVVASRTG